MKKRTVLYFGSFDPVHRGHTGLAEWVVENGYGDELVFIVSPQSPFKKEAEMAPEFLRYEMCSAAAKNSRYPEKILVSAVELTLERPSYTFRTLEFLEEQCGKEREFAILMGADNIAGLSRWKNSERITENYDILVYPREGYTFTPVSDRTRYLDGAPMLPFSSTEIRGRIREGLEVGEMLDPEVAKYIEANKLYICQDSE